MPTSDVIVKPTWNRLYDVTIENVTGGEVTSDKNQAIAGEIVSLTITPDNGYEFGSLTVWSGEYNEYEVVGNTATFTMPAWDVSVIPTWSKLFVVTIASVTGGEVTSDKNQAVDGEIVTLTISPADGYVLGSLEVENASTGGGIAVYEVSGTTATFTMQSSNVTVTPSWNKLYNVNVANVAGGEVTSDKAKTLAGETVTLTISPADGYLYGSLEVKDASNNSVAVTVTGTTATFTMPTSDVTVTLTWNKLYNVTVSNVTGGEVTSDKAKTLAGETVTLAISPDDGYELQSLVVKDASNKTVAVEILGNTATFTMPSSNVTVTPTWSKLYNVTVANVTGGEITSDKAKTLAGETVTLTIDSYDGYGFKSIKVEDASGNPVAVTVTGTTATFTMPASDVAVTPTWGELYRVAIISYTTGGEIISDKAIAMAGESVTLTISLDDGYGLKSIKVEDASDNPVAVTVIGTTATFTMPSSNVNVTYSVDKLYSVTVTNVTGGDVTSDKANAMFGETVTLTITPADGYVLQNLVVKDALNGGAIAVYDEVSGTTATFTMSTSDVYVIPTWGKLYDVTIAKVTGGNVTSDKATAAAGETVTLTIAPADGFAYGSLEVKDASNNTVAINVSGTTATFTMPSSNVTVTPTWGKLYNVTIANADWQWGSVTTDKAKAESGESVTLTITPDDGYAFGSLEVKDASNNSVAVEISDNTATFTMPASDVTVTPTWSKLYNVTIVNADWRWGSVTRDKAKAESGKTVTLTITPDYGYVLGSLEVKDESNNSVAVEISDNTATFTMPASDVSVTPTWSKLYNVSVPNGNPSEGKVTSDKAQAVAGETVTLTIAPTDGYMLESLKVVDDSDNSISVNLSGNTATFTMPASHVLVHSTWLTYEIIVYSETGGEVTSDKSNTLAGETVTLMITPADGYVYGSLEVVDASNNAVAVEVTGNTATFTMPTSNVYVYPTWNKLYNVTVANVTGGEVKADVATAVEGTSVTLTVSPAKDYMLANLEIKDENQNVVNTSITASSFSNTASFVMPSANVTVTPIWTKILSAEGGLFVNMPVSGEQNITIPDGVTSFKLYDDGGKEGDYSYNADGYLTVTAPEGKVLQVSGTVFSYSRYLKVFDGGNSQSTPLFNQETWYSYYYDIGTRISTGNVVTFYFGSGENSEMGFDLTVKVVKMDLALAKDGEGAYYVNMLAQNTATLNITDADIANGVTSFNIYDDGGVEYDHSWNVDGYLTITVPKDYVLQLTGYAKTFELGDDRSYFSVFDGNATASPLLKNFYQDFDDGKIDTTVSSGNVMTLYLKTKWNNHTTAPGLELKATLVRRGFGAVTITKADDGKFRATIDGTYTGTETLSIPDEIEVDEVDYDRELEVGVPVTAMLPVALPDGASVNADFYTLKKVEQVDDRWQATMTYIGDGKLPQPNTPYVVVLPEGETKLEFNLNNKKATVQTGPIQNVCGLDKDCVLDDKGNITDDWFFTGTYAYKVWNGADEEHGIEQHPELGLAYAFAATDNPGGAAKGKFGRIVAGAHANPMRCYLRKRDANVKLATAQQVAAASYVARYSVNYVPETIDVEFVKDDAKGGRTVLHGRMNTVTGEFKMLRDFDLKGRKVNSTNRARGAYYGKKVLKK